MCGIVAVLGSDGPPVEAMVAAIGHRGPDHASVWRSGDVSFGHARLRIIDLSEAADQPFTTADGRWTIVFNGELYNYRELRDELAIRCRTSSDTEVAAEAFALLGPAALDRFIGMFAFVIWDAVERRAFLVRDRFGVKPIYLADLPGGGVAVASEIGALHAGALGLEPDLEAWTRYLGTGVGEFDDRTFWRGIRPLPPGHVMEWRRDGACTTRRWYDPADGSEPIDERSDADLLAELEQLVTEAVNLRFRSDVPVGICLSGGLDSSLLLASVRATGRHDDVEAFTFTSGDASYDELPWVAAMLKGTAHRLNECRITVEEVPALAASVHRHVLEPYGGLPTLAYAKVFEAARARGVIVLLDGQGTDEGWCGYDYYRRTDRPAGIVQGGEDPPIRPHVLSVPVGDPGLADLPVGRNPRVSLQLRDLTRTKLPRALRYNDRVSMRSSVELREPFLDHRLVELGLRQPDDRLFNAHTGKLPLRSVARDLMPGDISEAPKRPVQTPQREWLRGPLRDWVHDTIEAGLLGPVGALVDAPAVRSELDRFMAGHGDNSYFVWQWLSAGLLVTT